MTYKHQKIGLALLLGGWLIRIANRNEQAPSKEEIVSGGSFKTKDIGTIMMVIGGGYLLFGKTK